MPVIFGHKGFRFFFYSNEGQPLEPIHIHVRHGAAEAKFWLNSIVRVAGSYGINAATLKELAAVVEQNRRLIERPGMSALAKTLRFDESSFWVELTDGRTLGVPLAWFPRLLHATGEQLARYELSGGGAGIHWENSTRISQWAACWAGEVISRPTAVSRPDSYPV